MGVGRQPCLAGRRGRVADPDRGRARPGLHPGHHGGAGDDQTALAEANLLAVHAGAVALVDRVVAIPAVSRAGKSTLAAACLRSGLDYVSDEALCLRWDSGEVVPYPRPIALSSWSAEQVAAPAADRSSGDRLLTAADFGAATASGSLELAHVVLPRRGEAGEPASLESAPRREAVAELLRRSFTSWRRPDRAFALVHEVVGCASTWRLTLGRPGDAARLVAGLIQA